MSEIIEPTEEEKRNGWDAPSLTAYLNERRAAQNVRANPFRRKPRPQWTNGSKWHWRRNPSWT